MSITRAYLRRVAEEAASGRSQRTRLRASGEPRRFVRGVATCSGISGVRAVAADDIAGRILPGQFRARPRQHRQAARQEDTSTGTARARSDLDQAERGLRLSGNPAKPSATYH